MHVFAHVSTREGSVALNQTYHDQTYHLTPLAVTNVNALSVRQLRLSDVSVILITDRLHGL